MRRDRFIAERSPRWAELEQLIKRGRRVRRLSGEDIFRLGQLYLDATSDLAVARRDFRTDAVTGYLNDLVARAHPVLYRPRSTSLARIAWFVRYGFPQAYRDAGPYIALAFAAFAGSGLMAAALVTLHPSLADVLLPGQAQQLRSIMAQHHLWMKGNTANHPLAANFIMVNNIQVALMAFATGILLGVPSLFVEAINGLQIGAIAAMAQQYGLSSQLWSFVFPHGYIELSVIFMAGGAGLMIGDSLLHPGLLRRSDALARSARHALKLLLGGAGLLVVAGTIEGFFSPSDAPDWTKYAVGLMTGCLLYAYLLFSRPKAAVPAYTFEELLAPAGGGAPYETSSLPSAGPLLPR